MNIQTALYNGTNYTVHVYNKLPNMSFKIQSDNKQDMQRELLDASTYLRTSEAPIMCMQISRETREILQS